jgi:hypothetical protein
MRANCQLSRRKSIYLVTFRFAHQSPTSIFSPSRNPSERGCRRSWRHHAGLPMMSNCHDRSAPQNSDEPLALAVLSSPLSGRNLRHGVAPILQGMELRNSKNFRFWNNCAQTIKLETLTICTLEPGHIRCLEDDVCQGTDWLKSRVSRLRS